MLEERRLVMYPDAILLLVAPLVVVVQVAHHGLQRVLQQPVHRLGVVEHEEELHQAGQVRGAEELADEAQLAVVDQEPRGLGVPVSM